MRGCPGARALKVATVQRTRKMLLRECDATRIRMEGLTQMNISPLMSHVDVLELVIAIEVDRRTADGRWLGEPLVGRGVARERVVSRVTLRVP